MQLVNFSFLENLGTALRVDNTNITLAGNSEFTHNYILCGANLAGGGGIIAGMVQNYGLDYGLDYGLNFGLDWTVASVLALLFKADYEC